MTAVWAQLGEVLVTPSPVVKYCHLQAVGYGFLLRNAEKTHNINAKLLGVFGDLSLIRIRWCGPRRTADLILEICIASGKLLVGNWLHG